MLTVQALEISWNFNIFSKFTKFHQTCRTYLNRHQKHACEIWANSEKLTYFTEKWRQCGPFEISWNFNIFSKFTKFHQTCRTYLNHHQKHACEIWENSEKLTYFIEKCWQCGPLKYHEISTFFQSSPNFINFAEHIGIIIRNMHVKLSQFREVDLFHRKMLTMPALWIIMKFQHFSKFTKFHQTCRIYLNHHQKHACEIWANSEKLYFFTEKCWQCLPFEISWNFNIFSKFTKFHQTCSTYLLESSSETCMWNLSLFREVDLFHRKMLTVPALWNIMKFQHFFKVHQISSKCRIYWNHHQKHACEIWAHSEKLYFFTEKCWQCRP